MGLRGLGSDGLACYQLYMSAKQLQHCMHASKGAKGLVVSAEELVRFPKSRFKTPASYYVCRRKLVRA